MAGVASFSFFGGHLVEGNDTPGGCAGCSTLGGS